jgi:peptidyl-tRNA hydrolase, PTH1 family
VKLIVGLGNPGPDYRDTRHNIGFAVVDLLARRSGLTFGGGPTDALIARARRPGEEALLAKPLTYMNLSGAAVAELVRYFRIATPDVLIVADDVNLPLGKLRARARGSDGGHNGFRSIIERLGTSEFARLRVGVGRGDPQRDLADHVLARFDADEQEAVDSAIGRAADAAELFVTDGIEKVMNQFNPEPAAGDLEGP